jgi:hypothetical protein
VKQTRFQLVLMIGLTVALGSSPMRAEADTAEQKAAKVKAAFLLNFIRYTTWPDERFAEADSPIELVVIGPDDMGSILDATMADKKQGLRPVTVRRVDWPDRRLPDDAYRQAVADLLDSISASEMVFVSSAMLGHLKVIEQGLGGKGVLIVGEDRVAAERGAALSLGIEDNRMVFFANLKVVRGESYQVSSKLLRLARIVEAEE